MDDPLPKLCPSFLIWKRRLLLYQIFSAIKVVHNLNLIMFLSLITQNHICGESYKQNEIWMSISSVSIATTLTPTLVMEAKSQAVRNQKFWEVFISKTFLIISVKPVCFFLHFGCTLEIFGHNWKSLKHFSIFSGKLSFIKKLRSPVNLSQISPKHSV